MRRRTGSLSVLKFNAACAYLLCLCLMVIVNEKSLNFEKTTSSVLTVLLLFYAYILPYYVIKLYF